MSDTVSTELGEQIAKYKEKYPDEPPEAIRSGGVQFVLNFKRSTLWQVEGFNLRFGTRRLTLFTIEGTVLFEQAIGAEARLGYLDDMYQGGLELPISASNAIVGSTLLHFVQADETPPDENLRSLHEGIQESLPAGVVLPGPILRSVKPVDNQI